MASGVGRYLLCRPNIRTFPIAAQLLHIFKVVPDTPRTRLLLKPDSRLLIVDAAFCADKTAETTYVGVSTELLEIETRSGERAHVSGFDECCWNNQNKHMQVYHRC